MQGWSARSRILTDRRAPTLRLPAKGDGCSTSEVLSTTRNRRAPGIAPTAFIGRSSFHSIHPLGRPPRLNRVSEDPELRWGCCGERGTAPLVPHAIARLRLRWAMLPAGRPLAGHRPDPCPWISSEGSSQHRAARSSRTGSGNVSPARSRTRKGSRPFGSGATAAPVTASTIASARGTDVPRTSRGVMRLPQKLRNNKTT
jgi:hypothetical protein